MNVLEVVAKGMVVAHLMNVLSFAQGYEGHSAANSIAFSKGNINQSRDAK